MSNSRNTNPKKIQKKQKSISRGRRTLYNSEMCERVKNQIISTGRVEDCYRILNISADTFHRWVKKYSEFSEAIQEGLAFRGKLKERNFARETQAAFEGLNKIVNGYYYEEEQFKYEYTQNEESGEVEERISSKIVNRKHIGPNIQAIKQVLGERDIMNAMFVSAMESYQIGETNELYKVFFGSLGEGNDVSDFKGYFLLNPLTDLVKLRLMESLVQKMFDDNAISFQMYMDYTGKLRSDYSAISDKVELRSQKLLKGSSYYQIILDFEDLWRRWLGILRQVLNDYKVEPAEKVNTIMKEVVDRINTQQDESLNLTRDIPLP